MTEDVKSGVKPIVLGGGLAILLGLVVFMLLPEPEITQSPTVEVTPPAQVAAPVVAEPVVAEPVVAPETTTPELVADAPFAPVRPAGPEFDTFRVETDGSMVIAGRAEPGQVVAIILAGETLDRVTADSNGNFVALPLAGPSDQPRKLSLLADPDGAAIPSETSYIVAPIAAPIVVAAAVVPETAPQEEAVAALPEAPQAPEPPVVVAEPVAAPTVLQADADGVRVVQDGSVASTENVALNAITYDPEGEVQLSGRAVGDGAVQVYIDNQPVTTSPVTQGGDWQIELPQIDTGIYTLRIDEVDEEGTVVSRLETPFKREERADVAAVLAEETSVDGFEVAVKTVQPGSTLWAIAEENLGAGIFYVAIFEANSDLIRDPDLIYPGQIFRIPEISQ